MSMKILQLCKKFPYPLKDGEAVAVTNLSRALNELGCEITLLCMNTTKHYTDISKLPKDFNHYKEIHSTDLDNSLKPIDAFVNLFSDESYHVSRYVSKSYARKLISLLKENDYDIIQLETLYLAPYVKLIKRHTEAHVVMRAHNVEHEIWERITRNTSFLPKKWYLAHLTKKLKRFEIDNLNSYDYLLAVTDRDLKRFKKLGYKNGASASPIGINTKDYPVKLEPNNKALSLSFIGSLDWMPNIEGLNWFTQNVWPALSEAFPDLSLHVAGRATPQSVYNLKLNNLTVHGEIPDAAFFIKQHPIMVVPLFSGSGMRVKILEGLALGRVVITTSLGLEGIDAKHKEHVLIADTAEEFIECLRYCYDNPNNISFISNNAREFVSNYYDNKEIAKGLHDLYQQLLVKGHSHSH